MIKTALTILAVAGSGFFAHSGGPGDAVVTVDGQAIVKQEFDRSMTIAARSVGSVVPDPATGYRRCIADKRKAPAALGQGRRKATDGELATECKQDYVRLRDQVLESLISFKWIE